MTGEAGALGCCNVLYMHSILKRKTTSPVSIRTAVPLYQSMSEDCLHPFHSNPAGIRLPNGVLQVLDFAIRIRESNTSRMVLENLVNCSDIVSSNSQVLMPLENSDTINQRPQFDKIAPELSYSSSLKAAVKLILGDPALVSETATHSLKFLRAARFLKENAPHAFQIREIGAMAQNSMDLWLWDLLEWKIDDAVH